MEDDMENLTPAGMHCSFKGTGSIAGITAWIPWEY